MTADREEIIVLKMKSEEMDKKLNSIQSGEKECSKGIRADLRDLEKTIADGLEKTNTKIDLTVKELSNTFVSNERFKPIELIIYGLVSLILVSFVSALIVLVMK